MAMIVNGRGYVGIGRSNPNRIDPDAQAFITSANITGATQQNAINGLVLTLKSYGIWTKMKAIYPFVGGTKESHKFNLKDPRNLPAAFTLAFSIGWVHSPTGAKPNGTSDYADTFLNGSKLTLYNTHLSYYSRSQSLQALNIEMGSTKIPNTNQILSLTLPRSSGFAYAIHTSQATSTHYAIPSGQTITQGLFINNRNGINATDLKLIRNNTILATASTNGTNIISNIINIYIGALNNDGIGADLFSNKECAFASIGDGLTDTDTTNLYTAVQTYQTSLGRQV